MKTEIEFQAELESEAYDLLVYEHERRRLKADCERCGYIPTEDDDND